MVGFLRLNKWSNNKWSNRKWSITKWSNNKWTNHKRINRKWSHNKRINRIWTNRKWTNRKWSNKKLTRRSFSTSRTVFTTRRATENSENTSNFPKPLPTKGTRSLYSVPRRTIRVRQCGQHVSVIFLRMHPIFLENKDTTKTAGFVLGTSQPNFEPESKARPNLLA